MVKDSTTATASIPGGTLSVGSYTFEVTVSRDGSSGSAQATVQVTSEEGAPLPVVAMATPPEEASPQLPFAYSAYVAESAECAARSGKVGGSKVGAPMARASQMRLLHRCQP